MSAAVIDPKTETEQPDILSTTDDVQKKSESKEAESKATEKNKEQDLADIARQDSVISRLLFSDTKKADDKAKADDGEGEGAEKKAEADKKKKSEKKSEEKKGEEGEPKKPVKVSRKKAEEPKPEMSREEIARLAATTAAEVVRQPKQAPTTPEPEVDDDLKAMAPVYAELEQMFPEKYKAGLLPRIAEFRRLELARADKWEKEHEGEVYDADAEEHAEFYAKHEPKINTSDIDEAKFEIRHRARLERDIKPETEQIKQELQRLKAEPLAQQSEIEFLVNLYGQLTGEKEVTQEKVAAWAKDNVETATLAESASTELRPLARTISLLWDNAEKMDSKNPLHTHAVELFNKMEAELSESEEAVVDTKGRNWVPLAQYEKLPADQKAKSFTTTKQALVRYAALNTANIIKSKAEETQKLFEAEAAKRGFAKKDVSTKTRDEEVEIETKHNARADSPEVGSGTPTPPSAGVGRSAKTTNKSSIDRMLGL